MGSQMSCTGKYLDGGKVPMRWKGPKLVGSFREIPVWREVSLMAGMLLDRWKNLNVWNVIVLCGFVSRNCGPFVLSYQG
jgi:hypothetical protein